MEDHVDFTVLLADWLGKPVWIWLTFLGIVAGLLTLDLGCCTGTTAQSA